jgi:hypothetical protein
MRRKRGVALAIGLFVAFGIIAVYEWRGSGAPGELSPAGAQHAPSARKDVSSNPIEGFDNQPLGVDPWGQSKTVTLDDARKVIEFTLLLPNDPLASDDLIANVWLNTPVVDPPDIPPSPKVAVEYSSSIQVIEKDADPNLKNPGAWEAYVQQSAQDESGVGIPLDQSTAIVNGILALVVAWDPKNSHVQTGSVQWLAPNQILITVSGNLDRATLLRVAGSVR